MKKKTICLLICIISTVFLSELSFSKAQDETVLTENYYENLTIYILNSGDAVYHWDITDEGVKFAFPINLPAPNSTTEAILDADLYFSLFEVTSKEAEMGIFANQYGGYMYEDLSGDQWEYGYSHIKLEFNIQFDDNQNISLGNSWVTNIVHEIENTFHLDFLQYNNYTYGAGDRWWASEYRAFPVDQASQWENILDEIPCGETMLLDKKVLNSSSNKATRIHARWDEFDPTPGEGESELRWEYDINLELFRPQVFSLRDNANNQVFFNTLLNFSKVFLMPEWVDDANLDIFLYKGAAITNVYPSPTGDGQEMGHIERQMDREGNMFGTLSDAAFFNFTDSNITQPIISCQLLSNASVINQGEDLVITRIIQNVGYASAYNLEYMDFDPYLIDVDNFDLISGNINQTITQLDSGQVDTQTMIIRCNHNENQIEEYQYYVEYDAIANPSLADHWSEPQFGGGRYQKSSNELLIFQNNVENYPWMNVDYTISDLSPEVGDNITISARITNKGVSNVENLDWQLNAFPDYGYSCDLGINLTSDSGKITQLNAGNTAEIEVNYTVDAYNRYFGGICEFSLDMQYDEIGGTQNIVMDSDNFYANDAGSAQYTVFPKKVPFFGPRINMNYNIDMKTNHTGTIITLDCIIENNGTSPAYNVEFLTSYRDGDELFFVKQLSGIDVYPDLNLGILQPGESVHFNARFILMKRVDIGNFSLNPFVMYTVHERDPSYGAWYSFTTMNQNQMDAENISERNTPAIIWMIVALSAIGIVGIESIIIYRKIKMI
ncbi:hypothetical protein NEF87_004698 [Candidatus Lokiarchaeum ossiferum]|uniref:CARDB domain-containing protein n=1 Tax=Candidatus Lokiarchaeum ossiferum TaxID=2951803 RepID=A0ABY6HY05_9ARCH|nr:hypothetical protein NEF87_004698 [Candidatus Lokiarchaeum sp. B-35]